MGVVCPLYEIALNPLYYFISASSGPKIETSSQESDNDSYRVIVVATLSVGELTILLDKFILPLEASLWNVKSRAEMVQEQTQCR